MNKKEALDLLKNGEIRIWNDYRKNHPYWKPDLQGENLSNINFAPFGEEPFNLTNANLVGCRLPEIDKLVKTADQVGIDFPSLAEKGNIDPKLLAPFRKAPLRGALIDRNTTMKRGFIDRILGMGGRTDRDTLVRLGATFLTEEELKRLRADVKRKIFISYAWAEGKMIEAFEQALREKGLVTIIDKRDFTAGEAISDEILRAMSDADAILLFHSSKTVGKRWIEFERDLARKLQETAAQKRKMPPQIIFVALDDTPLPETEKDRIAIVAKGKNFPQVCQEIFDNVLHLPKTSEDVDLKELENHVF